MAASNTDNLSAKEESMTRDELFTKVVEILTPYVTSNDAPKEFNEEATLLGDLLINSARLIDIVQDSSRPGHDRTTNPGDHPAETRGSKVELR